MLFKKFKAIFIKSIIIVTSIILIIVLAILKNNRAFCEWYSKTIQRGYLFIFGHISEYIPFSLMEVLIIGLGIFIIIEIVLIVRAFIRIRPIKAINKLMTIGVIVSSFLLLFSVSFSMGYNRDPLVLDVYEGEIKQEDFKSLINYFIDDFNYCSSQLEYKENGEVKSPYTLKEIGKILKKEYAKLDNSFLMKYTTSLKPLMTSFLFRDSHITGITFGVTGEANINTLATNCEIPFVAAHELAHTKGVFLEKEADYLATYITLNSDDYFLRYSGYMFSFNRLMSLASYTGNDGDYSELNGKIDPKIKANSSYITKYWKKHDLMAKFSDWLNNLYLKNNGVKEGTQNYGDTPTTTNEEEKKVKSLSNYQKIYFEIYYSNK